MGERVDCSAMGNMVAQYEYTSLDDDLQIERKRAPMSGRAVSSWNTVKPVVVRPPKCSEAQ